MGGFSRDTAASALAAGWEKREVVAAHAACGSLRPNPPVTDVFPFLAVLDARWLLYRGLWCFRDLAMTHAFPPGDGEVVAYGDGSGTTSGKPCGYGVAVYEPGRPPRYHGEHGGPGTNNRAELLAIWRALKAVPDARRPLRVRSDSQFALGAVQESSWHIKDPGLRALVLTIRSDVELRRVLGQRIKFEHVKGHAGTDGNEAADLLATLGRTAASGFPEPIFLAL